MSEEKKDQVEEKPSQETSSEKSSKEDSTKAESEKAIKEAETATKAAEEAEAAARALDEAEAAAKEAIAKAAAAKATAEKAAEAEYKAIADEVKAEAAKAPELTFKRQSEEIFRRDMGEPEFWLLKKDRFPIPILSQAQQDAQTRKVEIPVDNTPEYVPQHMLSPEYGGMSNYESGVGSFLDETKQKLEQLKNDPNATEKEISTAEHDLAYLDSLYENYYIGMNVFRTAHGGREKIKK